MFIFAIFKMLFKKRFMKRIAFIFLFSAGFAVWFGACQSVSDAQKTADIFFEALKTENYDKAYSMFDSSIIEQHGKEKLMGLLQKHNNNWPGIQSYSKYSFNTSTNNGITKVSLKFKVETSKGLVFENLEFIKRGNEYKIYGFFFSPDQADIDEE